MQTTKRQIIFATAIIVISVPVIIGSFALANSGPFKIDGFQMIKEIAKVTFEFTYGFAKLFVILIWGSITKSWVSGLTTLGIIALIILYWLYQRGEQK